jgi:hypothetical protein
MGGQILTLEITSQPADSNTSSSHDAKLCLRIYGCYVALTRVLLAEEKVSPSCEIRNPWK